MPRRKRYKSTASPRFGRGWIYWGLIVLLAGGIGWIWYKTRRTAASSPGLSQVSQKSPSPPRVPEALPQPVRQAAPQSVRSTVPPVLPRVDVLPRAPQDTFEAQLALTRQGISSGSLDGVMGPQTRSALLAFQQRERLALTGVLDEVTRSRLLIETEPVISYEVSSNDLARLQPVADTWLGKSQQSALDYETILELAAELSHANPKLIRKLNPSINWSNVVVGTELRIPNAAYPEPTELAAEVRISLSAKALQVFGEHSNLLAHFPCSIAQRVEKRPVGELYVTAIAPNPNYTFNPEVFPESPEAQSVGRKLIIQPGPNNPVGVAWVSLNLPGYGIHGTPHPEQVGRTESHGCFRLANWNAEYLLKLVRTGTPVCVEL